MDWQDARRSDEVEDRRGGGYADSGGGGGGGGGGIGIGTGSLGIGTIIVLALIGYATGIDPRILIGGAEVITGSHHSGYSSDPYNPPQPRQSRPQAGTQAGDGAGQAAPSDQTGDFVAAVLGELEDVWGKQLPAQTGVDYVRPRLVLYDGVTRSGCGQARAAMGPFYCPTDQKVYLDLAFFREMKQRLGGGGDFAYAYVIAHEVGHHVQNLLGVLSKVHQRQEESDQQTANALSVRLELQADCLAGVWAANANKEKNGSYFDAGDVAKAQATAAAIGDDTLQKASRGYAVPDSFTHGSAQQREKWLMTGLNSGQVKSCNTFAQ